MHRFAVFFFVLNEFPSFLLHGLGWHSSLLHLMLQLCVGVYGPSLPLDGLVRADVDETGLGHRRCGDDSHVVVWDGILSRGKGTVFTILPSLLGGVI